jgi:hypothetical protein
MAANPPIGNNIWEGVLGVVRINYNSIDLGKTTADTELVPDQDIKDIIFQQDGTKYQDKVPTGIAWMLNCTFGVITTTLLEQMLDGLDKSGGGNSLKFGKSIYFSWRENANPLIVRRVDSEGVASADPLHRMKFYLAYPEITGNVQWGADTQRNLAISFHLFYNETESAFGYSGYATSLGLTP